MANTIIQDSPLLQKMLAELADSRAGLAESFARFANWRGDSQAELLDMNEANAFRVIAETHRVRARSTETPVSSLSKQEMR